MPFFSLSIQNDFVIIAFRVNFLIPQNQFLNGSAFILFVYLLAFSSANVRSYHGALVTGSQMKHLTLPHMSSLQDILSLLTPLICITNCNKNLNSKKKSPNYSYLFISANSLTWQITQTLFYFAKKLFRFLDFPQNVLNASLHLFYFQILCS